MNFTEKKVSKEIEYFFYRSQEILFILIPVFLISGPLLSDLAISIISIIFIVETFYKKNFFFIKNKIFIFLITFYLYLLTINLINYTNPKSLIISFFYFRYIFFAIAVWKLIENNSKILKKFFFTLCICFTFLIVDGFYQYFFNQNIFGYHLSESNRVSSLFGDELILGSYLSRLFPIFFGIAIFVFEKKKNVIYFVSIIFILAEVLVFFSGERTAFFYINFSAIFMFLMLRKYKIFRLLIFVFSISIIILLSLFDDTGKKRIFDQTIQEMNLNQPTNNEDRILPNIFSKRHNDIYLTSYKIFKDNILTGVGIKNFRFECKNKKYFINNKESCSTHPHNTYVQLLVETGIIGFMFIFGLFLYTFFVSLNHFVKLFINKPIFSDFEVCILSSIFLTLWPFVPTGNFFNNWLNVIYFLPVGIFLWSYNRKTSKT